MTKALAPLAALLALLLAGAWGHFAPSYAAVEIAERPPLVCFPDTRARIGRWTFEHMTAETLRGSGTRLNQHFYGDESIPLEWRAEVSDYRNSGYDIFHLGAAADVGSQRWIRATFCLSNAAPGNLVLNRGLWAQIEKYVRELVDRDHELDIATGTLFIPDASGSFTIKPIGKNRVWPPTHFAKAVLVYEQDEPVRCLAWRCPNSAPPEGARESDCRVSVDEIEFDGGQNLFEWLPEEKQKRLESAK